MTYPWNNPATWYGTDQWPGPDSSGGPITLTVTTQPDNSPPRVRIDVDDITGSLTSATVTRLDPDGRWREVRTIDGNPLSLSNGSGTVFDNECPYGVPVTYTTDATGSPSVNAYLDVPSVWLVHPGIPSLSISITPARGSFTKRTRTITRGVFRPMGRKYPITVTDGVRHSRDTNLNILCDGPTTEAALEALLADGSPLLLNIPPSRGWNFSTCYVSVGDVDQDMGTDMVIGDWSTLTLPIQVVDRPAGGTRSSWTMGNIRDNFATMADIKAAFPKMRDIAAGV